MLTSVAQRVDPFTELIDHSLPARVESFAQPRIVGKDYPETVAFLDVEKVVDEDFLVILPVDVLSHSEHLRGKHFE